MNMHEVNWLDNDANEYPTCKTYNKIALPYDCLNPFPEKNTFDLN